MTNEEFKAAATYVPFNCEEVTPFIAMFDKHMRMLHPQISDAQFDGLQEENIPCWLKEYISVVLNDHDEVDNCIKALAMGPSRRVNYYNGYFVNGFKFHTLDYGSHKTTMNSGVSVLGSCHNDYERDYYGMLTEKLELDYLGDVENKVTLFKCDWFDINGGVRVLRRFGLVELNHKKKLQTNDVFILAQQLYYTCFPTNARDRLDWWTIVKTKARNVPNIQGIISKNEECNVWV